MAKVVRFLGFDPEEKQGKSLGEQLISFRRRNSLTQAGLARQLWVDESTVWEWGHEDYRPSPQLMERLGHLLRRG